MQVKVRKNKLSPPEDFAVMQSGMNDFLKAGWIACAWMDGRSDEAGGVLASPTRDHKR